MNHTQKLAQLRAALSAENIDGFLLPVGDEYLGEYVPDCAQRLAWLTGFTGSAGTVVVLQDKAALFTDGRYTLQSRMEVEQGLYEIHNSAEMKPEAWLAQHMQPGQRLAIDSMLLSVAQAERLAKALCEKGIALAQLTHNPIDALWNDRPAPPQGKAFVHPLSVAGVSHAVKRANLAKALQAENVDALVLAATDSINWLLNIRGRDLAYSPLLLAYALFARSGALTLYADPAKIPPEVQVYLGEDITIAPQERLAPDLAQLRGKRVALDAQTTPAWFAHVLTEAGAEVVRMEDPCQLPKARKNDAEVAAIRRAHVLDGLSLTRFLGWLAHQPPGTLRESQAALQLLAFRASVKEFISPSFETIAGSAGNGAIVHYRVSEKTDRVLQAGELLLLDSGGQYIDGTTDVTRTIVIGAPSEEQRTRYTQVLKGHIALAMVKFPDGVSGSQLDALARSPLWEAGVDFDHGTGHGVGCFLGVHEGPQRISKRGGDVALKPGMILSNEPGYYKEGAFGIRIENLVVVQQLGVMENGRPQYGFETLTCVPLDRALIDASLLTDAERGWLNAYHAWVFGVHAPSFSESELPWLEQACAPL